MELTREQAIAEHRKMWRWLAEHPEATKIEYIMQAEKMSYAEMIDGCFLCTYTNGNCIRCPLDWGTRYCFGDGDLLAKWLNTRSFEEKAKIAKQIAELPEREVEDE